MFKKLLIATLLIVTLFMMGCSKETSKEVQNESDTTKVGILQIVEHPALDEARAGFVAGLKEAGLEEGKNLTVFYQNAQNDQSNLQTMSNKLVEDKVDVLLGIATPAAISLANATEEIPILVTAVTDLEAAGLVESMEKPNTNVSGTTDMNPIEAQLKFILDILPETKKIGVIYNAGEVNSQIQVDLLKEKAKSLNIPEVVEATVATSSEVMQAAQSLVGKVDVIYVPTDNTVVSGYGAVVQVCEENKIPLVSGEAKPLETGGVGTVGVDYFELGKQTGQMAAKVLNGEDVKEMPVEFQKNPKLVINKKWAESINLEISKEILEKADSIIE